MSNFIKATPYPLPLGDTRPCLVIIDMQKDFIEPGGFGESLGNDVSKLAPCIPVIAVLLNAFRNLGLPVIHTREAHRSDLSDCPESKRLRGKPSNRIGDLGPMGRILIDGEPGNAIIDALAPIAGEYEIVKPGKGAFYNTPIDTILKQLNVRNLVFAGVTTEVCVQTTMREANDRGYNCLLVEDGTDSYFPEFKSATINMITAQSGIVGWVAQSQDVVSALSIKFQ